MHRDSRGKVGHQAVRLEIVPRGLRPELELGFDQMELRLLPAAHPDLLAGLSVQTQIPANSELKPKPEGEYCVSGKTWCSAAYASS